MKINLHSHLFLYCASLQLHTKPVSQSFSEDSSFVGKIMQHFADKDSNEKVRRCRVVYLAAGAAFPGTFQRSQHSCQGSAQRQKAASRRERRAGWLRGKWVSSGPGSSSSGLFEKFDCFFFLIWRDVFPGSGSEKPWSAGCDWSVSRVDLIVDRENTQWPGSVFSYLRRKSKQWSWRPPTRKGETK